MFASKKSILDQIRRKPGRDPKTSVSDAATDRPSSSKDSAESRQSFQNPSVRFSTRLNIPFGDLWTKDEVNLTGPIQVFGSDPTQFALFDGEIELAQVDYMSLAINQFVITPLSDEEVLAIVSR